jgi:hypothetical protein
MDVLGWDAPRDRTKGGVSGMSDVERWVIPEAALDGPPGTICAARRVAPDDPSFVGEVEVVRASEYQEAVDALRFYADEANWKLHVTPSGWSSAAAADDGERARAALRRQ